MQRQLSPEALARDGRFHRITTAERFADQRPGLGEDRKMDPGAEDVADRARRQMHGIFVGEIQALEGAGRTTYDYPDGEIPFAMKLDMARQCWDEARHVEISVKLGDHMGTEIGEYSEAVTLFEAACHPDAVFRLAGVNRRSRAWPSTSSPRCGTSPTTWVTRSCGSARIGCWPTR